MKAFRFPLESIRVMRQQRERTAQQNYARALTKCDAAARKLHVADEKLAEGRAAVNYELSQGAPASHIVGLRTWCVVLEIRCHECEAALTEARREAGLAFQALTLAAREREALDRFHEKSRRTWAHENQIAEQKIFDELAVQRQAVPALETQRLN
jgi:flagellar export protein FliJ